MPKFDANGVLEEENLKIDFIMGPGTSVFGDFIWNPNQGDVNMYKISMTGLMTSKN